MMESKLLVGGKSIVDTTTEQERALEERRRQIAEQHVSWPFHYEFILLKSFEVLLSTANEDLYYFYPADNNAIFIGSLNFKSDSLVSIFVICSDCGWTTLHVDSVYHQAKHEACKGRVPASFFAQSSGINVTVQNDTELLFSNIQNNFTLLKWRTRYGSALLFSKISLRPSLFQNTLLIIFEAWKVQNLGFVFCLKLRK